ncbi:PA14 domain-containing protein [Larkinella sp. C7]|uniref:PA14 domain-containing protein n=1 Tax=Larkinella sp. C7 TaxID=2576607 RepID=UPI0011111888|nr:PA14 domain-containing protein [Larkinella sp. C7]
MRKISYLAERNRTFINLIALLALLSLPSFRFSNINREEKTPSIVLKNMEKPATYIFEKSRNPGSGKPRRPILLPSYPSPNRKSASLGSDPIRFVFYTNKKQVSLGEEVELTITAHYMAMHPGLLATFPGSNAFSLKVIVPDGFIQTGGDYVDLIGTELSTHRKTVTYSLKGKFVSISSNHTFRLLRSHKDAGADSKFIEKSKFQIHCHNSAESLANAGSLKGSRIAVAEVACTPFPIVCSGNNFEIRNQTVTVAQTGTYSLAVSYRSHEKSAIGIVRIDGVAQNVAFAMTTSYLNQVVGTVSLSAGTHTIGLSSGTEGGLICFNNICLTNADNSCSYTPSATVSNTTPGCGTSVNLSATCEGSDCAGLNYSWSGNGVDQHGQTISVNTPSSDGFYTYTVTAVKSGCSKTAQTSITVNGCGSGSLVGCYVIRSKKTGQVLQSLSGDVVEQRAANSQANQIWKAESVGTNQYRFTTQDGSGKSMQVNSASQGELVRIGTYTGTDLQKWTLKSDNNGSYRINTSNGLTWDMRNYGVEPQLQLWGNLTEGFADQRLFGFESTGCPTTPPATGSCTTLRNADSPANLTGGLAYKYYQSIANNDWCSATGLSSQAVVSSGSVGTISLTPRQRDDHFGFEFTGYIQVPADGQYTFFLNSDDESRLSIGGQLIIAHSGCHGTATAGQEPSGSICLRAGYHPIQILYSQGDGGFGLQTFWQGPTFAKQEIPAGALFRSGTPNTVACNFVVSATAPATAGCGSAITLNAPCTGSDCNGLTYSWSTGQNGQSISTTVPSSNGTSTYTVTVSKNGCSSKTTQTTTTVNGCEAVSTICNPFPIVCSGNSQEVRNQTITVAQAGTYSLSVSYRSHEKSANGIVRVDGVAKNVAFAMTTSYLNQVVGAISLSAGNHTIGLSSGTEGGLVCFNEICLTSTTSTTSNCNYGLTVNSSNANPGCGAAITLNATCSGDCDGVNYSWSTGQNAQSINTNVPSNNGNLIYTVTANKNGCATKTAQIDVSVIGCPNSTNVATKTFMLTAIGGYETWSDNNTYSLRKFHAHPQHTKPAAGLTVKNIEHLNKVMNYWHELGGTHVSMPMVWEDTEPAAGQFEFRHWDWIFSKANSLGLKININLMPLVDFEHSDEKYRTSASWRYESEDAARKTVLDSNGMPKRENGVLLTEPAKHFMSYYSPKMENYRRWLNGVANYLANHTNSIGYIAVVTNHHKEANYYLNANSDFHASALNAWSNRYPGISSPPDETGGSDLLQQRWLKFRSETLINFVSEWVSILKAKNLKTVLDVGSFTDNNSRRGTWALLGMLPPNLDGVKHNPAWDYPAAFDTRIVASVRPSLASVEWTKECNNAIGCPPSLVPYLINNFKASIDAGATDLSFAFFDQETPFPNNDLDAIVNGLKSSGYWNKPIPIFNSNCTMEISVKEVMTQGKYTSDHFLNIFNNIKNTCGYPIIKVKNDLE